MSTGLVVVARGDELIELADEALIGRARQSRLRIDEPGVHRFHAALLSEGDTLTLRALSAPAVRVARVMGAVVLDLPSVRVEVEQAWWFGSQSVVVVHVESSESADNRTARSGVTWHRRADGFLVRAPRADVVVPGRAGRLAAILLEEPGSWVAEDVVITRMWPNDLEFLDRRTRTNNLNNAIAMLKRILEQAGAAYVESRALPGDGPAAPGGRLSRTHLRLPFGPHDRLIP